MLVSHFMVNSMLKILKGITVECMECLNEDAQKEEKYDTFLTLKVGTIKSLPEPNYLMPYTIKHSKGRTFAVHQQCSLCRENFHSLPTTTYFSVLIIRQENFQC